MTDPANKAINNISFDTGSFRIGLDVFDPDKPDEPIAREQIHAYVDKVANGYQVKMYSTLHTKSSFLGKVDGTDTYIGDIHATYEATIPTLTVALIGVLQSIATYEDSLLAHLEITGRNPEKVA